MKRFLLVLALVTVTPLPGVAAAAEQTVRMAVENMTCVTCPIIVERSLKAVPGVDRVEISMEGKNAVVTFDDTQTTVAALVKATTNAGFPSKPVKQLSEFWGG